MGRDNEIRRVVRFEAIISDVVDEEHFRELLDKVESEMIEKYGEDHEATVGRTVRVE